MSVKVSHWVFTESLAGGIDRLVLLAIADSANDQGEQAWLCLDTLAAKCGVHRATVVRAIERLVGSGELRRVRRGDADHSARRRSNEYHVVMGSQIATVNAEVNSRSVRPTTVAECDSTQSQSATSQEEPSLNRPLIRPAVNDADASSLPGIVAPSLEQQPKRAKRWSSDAREAATRVFDRRKDAGYEQPAGAWRSYAEVAQHWLAAVSLERFVAAAAAVPTVTVRSVEFELNRDRANGASECEEDRSWMVRRIGDSPF